MQLQRVGELLRHPDTRRVEYRNKGCPAPYRTSRYAIIRSCYDLGYVANKRNCWQFKEDRPVLILPIDIFHTQQVIRIAYLLNASKTLLTLIRAISAKDVPHKT